MPSLLWKTDTDSRPVLVAAVRIVSEQGNPVAATGQRVLVYAPDNGEYNLYAELNAEGDVTGLADFTPGRVTENIIASTADRIVVWASRQGIIQLSARSDPEPGAGFTGVAAGDLDNDGRDEIAAIASEQENLYVYRQNEADGTMSLDLVGIRALPGTPRFVAIFSRPGGFRSIAVAYENSGNTSGLAVYSLTDQGFEAGPVLAGLPFVISYLAAGDFGPGPGEELAFGGAGGMVWLAGVGEQAIKVLAVTDSLGAEVSALSRLGSGAADNLLAGTPAGNIYYFNYPAGRSPDIVFNSLDGVYGLAGLPGGRALVGTAAGGVQVWSVFNDNNTAGRYIVVSGDTLWKISARFGVPVQEIVSVNNNISDPNLIMPGQVILIPHIKK